MGLKGRNVWVVYEEFLLLLSGGPHTAYFCSDGAVSLQRYTDATVS